MFDVGAIGTGINKNGELVVGPGDGMITGSGEGLANTGTPSEDGGSDGVGIVFEGNTRIGAVGLATIGTNVKGMS